MWHGHVDQLHQSLQVAGLWGFLAAAWKQLGLLVGLNLKADGSSTSHLNGCAEQDEPGQKTGAEVKIHRQGRRVQGRPGFRVREQWSVLEYMSLTPPSRSAPCPAAAAAAAAALGHVLRPLPQPHLPRLLRQAVGAVDTAHPQRCHILQDGQASGQGWQAQCHDPPPCATASASVCAPQRRQPRPGRQPTVQFQRSLSKNRYSL